MATTSRKDFDAELVAWLAALKDEQAGDVLDAYVDLYLRNAEAAAIADKGSPAAKAKHAEINGLLDRIVGA